LGDGTEIGRSFPSEVYVADGKTVVDIGLTNSASFAVIDDGRLFGWGSFRTAAPTAFSPFGTLQSFTPIPLTPNPLWSGLNITNVYCGGGVMVAAVGPDPPPAQPPVQPSVQPPVQPPQLFVAPSLVQDNACDQQPPTLPATCIRGVWFVNASLVVNFPLNLTSSIVVTGNLSLTSTGALVVSLNGSATNTISVKGCATLDGTITIVVDDLNAAQSSSGEITIALFDEGYCSGSPTQVATLDIRAGCRRAPLAELRYNTKSLSVVLGNLDSTACDQAAQGGLSIGAIAGISVAVVVVCVVAIAAMIFLFKRKILPYFAAKNTRESEAMSAWQRSETS
jgi:hypothetical protein